MTIWMERKGTTYLFPQTSILRDDLRHLGLATVFEKAELGL
jgi:hypothetical protein